MGEEDPKILWDERPKKKLRRLLREGVRGNI